MITTLETERLVLRPFTRDDRAALSTLGAEESFWWFGMRRGATAEESSAFLERVIASYEEETPGIHAVVERATGELAGYAGLSIPRFLPEVLPAIEVGWRLGTAYRGRGYATEAGAAALTWGFTELGLTRVLSICEPDNIASYRVMDHLGFDGGFATVHPVTGVPLVVRALEARRWSSGPPSPGDGLPARE